MRVLLDHCVPRPFGRLLVGHDVRTAKSEGWHDISNGELLLSAAEHFDVLVTVDLNLAFQQSRGELPLPVVAMRAESNTIDAVAVLAPQVLVLLSQQLQRRVHVVERPE